jgi:hypothetical protein
MIAFTAIAAQRESFAIRARAERRRLCVSGLCRGPHF